MHYNFCSIHKTLRVTLAMAAGGTGGMRFFSIAFSFAEWNNAHLPIQFSLLQRMPSFFERRVLSSQSPYEDRCL
jgi:hypothetical protein